MLRLLAGVVMSWWLVGAGGASADEAKPPPDVKPPADARPTPEAEAAARAAYHEGLRRYALAEYKAALTAFKEAYLKVESPAFLYNIAQCHRQLGDKEDAARIYRNYLQLEPQASDRAEIERIIGELEHAVETDRVLKTSPPHQVVAPPPTLVRAPPPPPPPRRNRTPLWVGLGVAAGVVVLGVAIGVGVGVQARADAAVPDADRRVVSFP